MILLDGGMGTMLQAAGMQPGQRPELFGLEHPALLETIHRRYLEAGSDVLYANTFCANRRKLEGTGVSVEKAIFSGVACARRAAGQKAQVALDVGPIGELLEPLGTLTFEEAYEIYREMVTAGEQAGADLIVLETFTDLNDIRAAVLAAQEHTHLPIWCTMSFEPSGRTFTGTAVSSMAVTLTALGVDAIGINCSLGPKEIYPLIQELMQWTELPILVKPNAGLPDPATGLYELDAKGFAAQMAAFSALGVYAVGGCCGTTPDYIRALAPMRGFPLTAARPAVRRGVCSASRIAEFGGTRVVGERLNPTGKKRFQQALREHDMDYILQRAIEQEDAGADILDINVGLPGLDEAQMMTDVVNAVQGIVSLPLQIDSSDPQAIEAGLRACCGRAIVNSVNGNPEVLERVLPLVKRYGAAVIGLTMDSHGIPQTAEERVVIARRILDAAAAHGIPKGDVLIDCLTLTVSAQQEQAKQTLRAVRQVRHELGAHCTLGISNISFGLPCRENITEIFLTQALCCGLDFPILNPNQKRMMDAVASHRVLSGEDRNCAAYIARFANSANRTSNSDTAENSSMTVEVAIRKGLKDEAAALTTELLKTMDELDLINQRLIPALDAVGLLYEQQVIFLPQLINAANAAGAAFEIIKTRIANRGAAQVSRGTIIMATVHGDIHDIGKNIVKVILENYGYHIIDLGRDVPAETVVRTAIEKDVKLVGLSALMTTTVVSMAETIAALRASGHACKIFVGGAVLTPEYAAQIGADYYAKDARESVEIAKKVLG
jgi:5-methyltetrahydrofolate--homocysteine methyltransferase